MKDKIKPLLISFLFWFSLFWLLSTLFLQPQKEIGSVAETPYIAKLIDRTVVMGNLAEFQLINRTSEVANVSGVQFFRLASGKEIETTPEGFVFEPVVIEANGTESFKFPSIQNNFASEAGEYQIRFVVNETTLDGEVLEIQEPSSIRQLFRAIIIKPLFNGLVALTQVLPGHSMGWSIILLTICVRLILFLPNQKAMRSQRELQKLQPQIEALRKKHGENQQEIAMKTMELYRTNKINPMSSCLPMLMQMPFLIGLYFIVVDGISPHMTPLLYNFHTPDFAVVNTQFGVWKLDEVASVFSDPWILVLALLVGAAQYGAIKLSMIQNKSVATPTEGIAAQMAQMQKFMLYGLPVMITGFTLFFPAGVGFYWLTSTLFGAAQQKLVNYNLDKGGEVRVKAG